MSTPCFIGIDTSNYTTSVGVCSLEGVVLANFKKLLDVAQGERGLRQSDAVFSHVKNLPELCALLREILKEQDLTPLAIGYSATPRTSEGSYMPCFLSGRVAAEAMGAVLDLPLYAFSHQMGHVMAAAYSSGEAETLLHDRFVAFHVSGGTTDVLLVTPEKVNFSVAQIGGTADLNAGQAIDRAGVMMGLKFPCGREMEGLALSYRGKLPTAKIAVSRDGCECHLSGLENLSQKLYAETQDKALVSAFVFSFVEKTLAALAASLPPEAQGLPLLFSGGVMSNSLIKAGLAKRFKSYFAEPAFSADNAAGTSLLCRAAYLAER